MKILITGITGFIGSNLVLFFSSLNNVIIYGLDIINPELHGVEKIFSWNELDKIPNVNAIIHLAGKSHDTTNTSQEQDYIDINYGLTKKIYDYFLQSSAKQFYLMSSVKAVADHLDRILTEDAEPNPKTPYGKSKRMAEEYLLSNLPDDSKQVYIFRPCMIYGPGNKGNLNLLYKLVTKGIPWPLGSFNNKRSFFSVNNLNFLFNEFMMNDYPSGVYQLADDEPISTNKLIRLIAEATNRKVKICKISPLIIKTFAKVGDMLHLPLNSERLKKLTESYMVSNTKIKKTLVIEKMPINTIDGITNTLKSFE